MSQDPNQILPESENTDHNTVTSAPPKNKVKEEPKLPTSFSEIMEAAEKVNSEKPKAFEEYITLFEALRGLSDLTNTQIKDYFRFIKSKIEKQWIPYLTKLAVILCQKRQDLDSKLITRIQKICLGILREYHIEEDILQKAKINLCTLRKGEYVTQFLQYAQQKNIQKEKQLSHGELASLTFIYFTLHNKEYTGGDFSIQLMIDRAIAEFFSDRERCNIKESQLAGKTLGNILSGKVYSPKKVCELTYLYAGTTQRIDAQNEQIARLEEIRKEQAERITILSDALKDVRAKNQELQDQVVSLGAQIQQLTEERNQAENMLEFEKNKFAHQIKSQEAGVSKQLSYEIGLDLQDLRELVEHLNDADKRRIIRRLDRIDRTLLELRRNK